MPTKLQKYDKYKPSGLDWLGDIPEGWDLVKFNDFAKIIEGQVNPQNEPFKSMTLIAPNHLEKNTGDIINTETADEQGADSGKYLFRNGDIVYSKIRPYLRKACLVGFDGICSADMYPIRLKKYRSDNQYFLKFILCDGFSDFMTMRSSRVAMPKVNREDFQECLYLQPPLQTQTAIANYLDTHTANIDREIELLTAKVSKYQQLKQTLISNTVTKGLDKSAKLKPSGVEWIGDIPEGWEVRRLKDFITFSIAGEVIDVSYWGEGEELMYSAGKYPVMCNFENFPNRKRTKQNDILIARNGDGFIHAPEVGAIYTNVVQMARLSVQVNKYFILYVMDTIKFNINQTSNGDFIASLNKALWFNSDLPFPPLQIQQQIANYLDEKTGQIDQIITTINNKITKLKEYRKVLINDVVTGRVKIEN